MTRSRRKMPIIPMISAESDKQFKRQEHRRKRAHVRAALARGDEDMPAPKLFGDPWDGDKDGKQYVTDPRLLRK